MKIIEMEDTMNSCKLKFGPSQTSQLPVITLPSGALGTEPTVLTTLRLDAAYLRNPCVKLDFVTNFNAFGITAGTLKFQVYKKFDNSEPIPVGPAWTFGPIAIGYQPISFFVEDCDMTACSNQTCCTYIVEVSAAEMIVAEVGYAAFANSMLAATISSCGDNGCNK